MASRHLTILTCIWQRLPVARAVLDYWDKIRIPGWTKSMVVVGSEGLRSMEVCPAGVTYVEAPNAPLGRKWNSGLMGCRLSNPDAVMVVGSDDILNVRAIEILLDGLRGVDWVQPDGCWMWDALTDDLAWMRFDTGAGRIYSRQLLDRIDWKLWRDDATVKLDGDALDRLINARARRREVEPIYSKGGVILDIKTGVNLWPYSEMHALLEPPETDLFIEDLLQDCEMSDIDGFCRTIREFAESTYLDAAPATNRATL